MDYLFETLEKDPGWRPLDIPAMTLLSFEHQEIQNPIARPFHFTVQRRSGAMPEGVI